MVRAQGPQPFHLSQCSGGPGYCPCVDHTQRVLFLCICQLPNLKHSTRKVSFLLTILLRLGMLCIALYPRERSLPRVGTVLWLQIAPASLPYASRSRAALRSLQTSQCHTASIVLFFHISGTGAGRVGLFASATRTGRLGKRPALGLLPAMRLAR